MSTTGPSIKISDCIFLHDLQSPPITNMATLTRHSNTDLHAFNTFLIILPACCSSFSRFYICTHLPYPKYYPTLISVTFLISYYALPGILATLTSQTVSGVCGITLRGTWSHVLLARHGGGACGAGGVKGPWCVQTVSTHSRAPLGYWAEGRSQLLKLQGCRRVIFHLEC